MIRADGETPAFEAAQFGSLDPEIAADIAQLRAFAASRQRYLSELFGRALKHSPLRDELIRLVILSFAAGKHQRIAFYVRACAEYATEPSVRVEIANLESARLVLLGRDEGHPRALLVAPTMKLIQFYNEQMPRLRSEIMRMLSSEVEKLF